MTEYLTSLIFLADATQVRVIFNISRIISRFTNTWEAEAEMPEKSRTASGSAAKLPEVANALHQDNSIPNKINLSVEEEIAHLRERNRQLEAENALLRERDNALTHDGIETLNVAIGALRTIQPGREADQFVRQSEESIRTASPEDRPFIINARIKRAATMIKDTPAPSVSEPTGPDPLRYDVKTLNQKRAEAIAAHVQQTGKTSIKSVEARAVLETVEHRRLDRKTVWRALRAARGILRATADKMGGVTRLIIPGSPSQKRTLDVSDGRHDSGGGGERSRLLRSTPLGSG